MLEEIAVKTIMSQYDILLHSVNNMHFIVYNVNPLICLSVCQFSPLVFMFVKREIIYPWAYFNQTMG